MFSDPQKRFIYFGSALGIGATMTSPMLDYLTDQTAVVLPPTGGYATQTTEFTNFRDVIRAGRITTTVVGKRSGDHFSTLATVTIEDLDILGFIRADAIVGRVAAKYPADQHGVPVKSVNGRPHPTFFHFHGSAYTGLKIAGSLHEPTLRKSIHPYRALPEKPGMVKDEKNPEIYWDPQSGACQVEHGTTTRIKLFEGPDSISFEEFGTIYFADVDFFGQKASLTMLRFELGCGANVNGSSGNCTTNGHDGSD